MNSKQRSGGDPGLSYLSRFTVYGLRRFHQRCYELEHLDKGDYTPEEYEGCIVELQRVNRWLGDVSALKHSLLAEINSLDLRSFSVLDVGAGSGELLRTIATWSRK